jgi:Flp pilus assembly protein TadD
MTIAEAMELATQHHTAGRFAEAEQIYQVVLGQMPENAHAMHYLGLIQLSRGQRAEGLRLMRESLKLDPSAGIFHMNLAGALLETGDAYGAEQAARQAIAMNVEGAQPHINLGQALWRQLRQEEALQAMQKAAELEPLRPDVHSFVGVYRTALGRHEQAIPSLRRAIELEPQRAFHYANLGAELYAIRELAESEAMYRQAIAIEPARAEYHADMAMPMLAAGNWTQGLKEAEWRSRVTRPGTPGRTFAQPLWDGSPLEGKTIFVYSEQGLGDAILFSRYVPLLASKGAKVILEVRPPLLPLFQSLKGVKELIPTGQQPPAFDYHSPMLSLPLQSGTTPATIPADVPYLSADAARIQRWHQMIQSPGDVKLRVGLAWGGRKAAVHDAQRSLNLADLEPLAKVQGIRWYSLQVGPDTKQLEQAPQGFEITNIGQHFVDFADCAAAMASLDLVICGDTTEANLAGATGRPVWMLEPYLPHWPWLMPGDTTPWYPSMRLFRQPVHNDWASVIASVHAALQQLIAK